MAKSSRFWRNVVLIAVAHIALIAGLIRWSLAARTSSNSESVVWLGGAGDLALGESEGGILPSPPAEVSTPRPEPTPMKTDEGDEERRVAATVKSEIELPSPTPTATPSSKPTATPTPRPKTTPKPIPKPSPKKILLAKASPKPSPKANGKSEKKEKNALAKTESASQSASGKTSSVGTGGRAGGGSSTSEFGWYGNMLHDRFYSAWIQPTTHVPTGAKISTLVKVRIEKDGRVSKFEIIKPSENVVVNESVTAVAKQVTEVDAPPAGLMKDDHYEVKINFELNTGEGPGDR